MAQRIHMHDQVNNKIEAIMSHHRRVPLEPWAMKGGLLAVCLAAAVYWSGNS